MSSPTERIEYVIMATTLARAPFGANAEHAGPVRLTDARPTVPMPAIQRACSNLRRRRLHGQIALGVERKSRVALEARSIRRAGSRVEDADAPQEGGEVASRRRRFLNMLIDFAVCWRASPTR